MASVRIGHVRGIPLQLHVSFLLVLPFFAYLMARAYFAPEDRLDAYSWIWGSLLAIGLFASVMLHELAHSLTALREGIGVRSILLLPIGGVSSFREMPEDPGVEFRITVVGPLTNFALGLPLVALSWLVGVPDVLPRLSDFVFWLGALNVLLGGFNLLVPAFPMDGGRVLRALLTRPLGRMRATRAAAGVGRGLAVVMGVWGFLTFAAGGWLLLLIALFVFSGANQEEEATRVASVLSRYHVGDLMTREVDTLAPHVTVEEALARMLETKHVAFPVLADGPASPIVGIVTLADIHGLPDESRWRTPVADVARREYVVLSPSDEATVASRRLAAADRVPAVVVHDGRLVGIVTQTDLDRFVQIAGAQLVAAPPRRGMTGGASG